MPGDRFAGGLWGPLCSQLALMEPGEGACCRPGIHLWEYLVFERWGELGGGEGDLGAVGRLKEPC